MNTQTFRKSKAPKMRLERGGKDRLLPRQFMRVLTRRYLPVLSLTYIASILGIAVQQGDAEYYLFEDYYAYSLALLPALWVSVPAVLWIFLKSSHAFYQSANRWYIAMAVTMSALLGLSYVLLPELDLNGARTYLVATIPMMVVLYFAFVKSALPASLANTLSIFGLTALLYGAAIRLWM